MRSSKYTVELLSPIVAGSVSLAQVLRTLGLRPTGGNYRMIAARLRFLGISTAHFKSQGWASGQTAETNSAVARVAARNARADAEVFVQNSPESSGHRLTRRLLRRGWDYRCSICGLVDWQGSKLKLHLDHINGIHNDNRLGNLRFMCPNCHAQTVTYGNRSRRSDSQAQ